MAHTSHAICKDCERVKWGSIHTTMEYVYKTRSTRVHGSAPNVTSQHRAQLWRHRLRREETEHPLLLASRPAVSA